MRAFPEGLFETREFHYSSLPNRTPLNTISFTADSFEGLTTLETIKLARTAPFALPEGFFATLPALSKIVLEDIALGEFPYFQSTSVTSVRVDRLRMRAIDLDRLHRLLPALQDLNLGTDSLDAVSVSNAFNMNQLQALAAVFRDCNVLTRLPYSNATQLASLTVSCQENMVELRQEHLPNQLRLADLKLLVVSPVKIVDLDTFWNVFQFYGTTSQQKNLRSLVSSSALLSCSVTANSTSFRPSCNCPGSFQGAPHCPAVEPMLCPGQALKSVLPHQVCDGQADCDDGYDERFCRGKVVALDPRVNFEAQVSCLLEQSLTIVSGVFHIPSRKTESREASCLTVHGVVRGWHELEGAVGRITFR
jgi:hypothetical protein